MSGLILNIGNSVVHRYVKSLYEVSVMMNCEKNFLEQIKNIGNFINKLEDSEKILKRLSLLSKNGFDFVQEMINELSLSKEIGNFLKLLLKNKRFELLPEICIAYENFIDSIHGKKTFYITYAKNFDKKMKKDLEEKLKSIFTGDLEFIFNADNALIDGFKIQYHSKVLDYSMKSKLVRLGNAIRGDIYEY